MIELQNSSLGHVWFSNVSSLTQIGILLIILRRFFRNYLGFFALFYFKNKPSRRKSPYKTPFIYISKKVTIYGFKKNSKTAKTGKVAFLEANKIINRNRNDQHRTIANWKFQGPSDQLVSNFFQNVFLYNLLLLLFGLMY